MNSKLLFTILFFISTTSLVQAQTVHYVTNLFDNGGGSFRATVNAAFSGDTIRFDPLVTGTISLTSGSISWAKDLHIEGPGANILTITTTGVLSDARIFSATNSNLFIEGLTIDEGKGDGNSGAGGGFFFDGLNLELKNIHIKNCSTGIYGKKGGGLYAFGTNITLDNVQVSNSYSSGPYDDAFGGGAYLECINLNITNSAFSSNEVSMTTGDNYDIAKGGGLAIFADSIFLENNIFDSNRAFGDPGSGNSGRSHGGGLYIYQEIGDVASVKNCTFTENEVDTYASSSATGYAEGAGFYVHCADSAHVFVQNCNFLNNRLQLTSTGNGFVTGSGGGIYALINEGGVVEVKNSTFEGNNITNRGCAVVGEFYDTGQSNSGRLLIDNCTIFNQSALSSPTIYAASTGQSGTVAGGNVLIQNTTIRDNEGQGIQVNLLESFTVRNCLFYKNGLSGISIYESGNSISNIYNSSFYANGSSLFSSFYDILINSSNLTNVFNCTMVGDSTGSGRNIQISNGTLFLKNNIITSLTGTINNPLVNTSTGGVIVSGGGNIVLDNSASSSFNSADLLSTNPQIEYYQDNGGPNWTFALQSTSPAIDLGGMDTLTTDQRGFGRDPNNVDAGAFEFGAVSVAPPVVTSTSGNSTICEGDDTTLSITASGSGVTYQWQLNGSNLSGETSNTLDLSNVLPSSEGNYQCIASNSAGQSTSNQIYLTVNPLVTPTVNITSNQGNTICNGTSVTFSAAPSGQGTNPTYAWKKNGLIVGTNATTYSDAALSNNDVIVCELSSSQSCASPQLVSSNPITMTVTPSIAPTINITSNQGNTICNGTSVTFSAAPSGQGASPTYTWKKNGFVVGSNSTTYTDPALSNNDVIICELLSSESCASPQLVGSNPITMTVNATIAPTISISSDLGNSICAGTSVTFSATSSGQGTNPTYTWKKNGNIVGTNSSTYTAASLNNNDLIICELASSEDCASSQLVSSNPITMTVNDLPEVIITQSGSTLSVDDIYSSYQWYMDGMLIAAATTSEYTASESGSYTIEVADGLGCLGTSAPFQFTISSIRNPILGNQLTIHPNPAYQLLNIKLDNLMNIEARLYDVNGRKLLTTTLVKKHTVLNLENIPIGVYFLHFSTQQHTWVEKLIIE